eukprot:TRINITY_DN1551_c0_g2_i1.p1 TRINITY_DN1551_c0_g2~~TRINITY_DN1551_c0_g2_i1.p1  ORF type:complete len:567 (-),score=45.70 TRINITY_DN1551_c0_g2_i1:209-1909(-)
MVDVYVTAISLSLGGIAILAYVMFIVRAVVIRSFALCHIASDIRAEVKLLLRGISEIGRCLFNRTENEQSTKVRNLCCTWRLDRMRLCNKIIMHLLMLILCNLFFRFYRGDNVDSSGYFFYIPLYLTAIVVFETYQSSFTCFRMDCVRTLGAAGSVLQIIMIETFPELIGHRAMKVALQIFSSVVYGNPVLSCAFAFANSTTYLVCYVRLSANFDGDVPFTVPVTAARELAIFAMISTLCFAFDSWTSAQAAATVALRDSQGVESVTTSLLSATCDAVVSLDSSNSVCSPCPSLEVLLLRQPARPGFLGYPFIELIADSDRHKFQDGVRKSSASACRAVTVYVHLLDGQGIRINCRLLISSFKDMDGSTICFVGVFDLGAHEPANNVVYPLKQQLLGRHSSSRSSASNESFGNDQSKSSDSIAERPLELASLGESAEDVMVWFDPFTRDHSVLRCTAGFSVLCGPCSTSSSLKVLLKNHDAFKVAFQTYANRYYGSNERNLRRVCIGEVVLLPRSAQHDNVEYQGSCTLIFDEGSQDTACASFHDLKEKRASRPRKSQRLRKALSL